MSDKLCPTLSQVLRAADGRPYLYEVFCREKSCALWDYEDKVCSVVSNKDTLGAIYYLLGDIAKGRR